MYTIKITGWKYWWPGENVINPNISWKLLMLNLCSFLVLRSKFSAWKVCGDISDDLLSFFEGNRFDTADDTLVPVPVNFRSTQDVIVVWRVLCVLKLPGCTFDLLSRRPWQEFLPKTSRNYSYVYATNKRDSKYKTRRFENICSLQHSFHLFGYTIFH